MKFVKSKGGYYYKIYKNGKKKRISKKKYLKRRTEQIKKKLIGSGSCSSKPREEIIIPLRTEKPPKQENTQHQVTEKTPNQERLLPKITPQKNNKKNLLGITGLPGKETVNWHQRLVDNDVNIQKIYPRFKLRFFRNNEIGRGFFGIVYKGRANFGITSEEVAIKIPKIKEVDIHKIIDEVKLAKSLTHPCILKTYGLVFLETTALLADREFAIISEYIDGYTLQTLIRSFKYPLDLSKSNIRITCSVIMFQCLSAIQYLHSEEVIHHDIKPENIMITNQDEVKIIDFGLSLKLNKSIHIIGECGTLAFLHPNRFAKKKSYTDPKHLDKPSNTKYLMRKHTIGEQTDYLFYNKKVDIWALGLTFYYLLTGKLPTHKENISKSFHFLLRLTVRNIHTWLSELEESPIKELLNIMLNPNDTLNNNQTGKMNMDFICDSERPWIQYLIEQVRLARSKGFHIGYCNQLGINLEINQTLINNTNVLPDNRSVGRLNNNSTVQSSNNNSFKTVMSL